MLKNNLLLKLAIAVILGLFINTSLILKSKAEACCPFSFSSAVESKVKTDKIVLKIEGMTCQECVKKVNNSLKKIKGVKKVAVNLQNGEAIVEYEKGKVRKEEIIRVVEKVGFNAELKP